ncbi:Gfo/Idh/MocA family protein [Quadrisphaera setariae]|uniref:Gfo/Idh/MocA family oxidoreductase n=1 Tax=Quadrisphaera setariae TaxID=2593304 RepID=A0A5C8Z475_9ACTN|nr:Gfo/Idh/MocA family oxidoreductase [Quadrisphaera setariae]TXR51716.1 Gfo/Idh/MocA family oxidoreductase [Quadrisphaera setariae]
MSKPLRVGVVGAGKISEQYSLNLARLPQLALTAVADLDTARAEALASAHEGARALPLQQLLEADDVDVVLNLTIPAAHAEVALAAIAAGKHVYGEKPLAATTAEGRAVLEAAAAAGVRVGCAPDTVLGTGVQTARAAVEAGLIGTPHAATATFVAPGHELWHPSPEFYYAPGGGPLLDMGPYYMTSLVHLLGPVSRVTGLASAPRSSRTVATGPKAGLEFEVTTPSHVTGLLQHRDGALTTVVMSFDVWGSRAPRLEVHGPKGSLSVPDPNYFEGSVELCSPDVAGLDQWGRAQWKELEPSAGYAGAGRGEGLADLALGLGSGTAHRASGEVALHVLDVMEQVLASAASGGAPVEVTSTCERPEPVAGLVDLTAQTASA